MTAPSSGEATEQADQEQQPPPRHDVDQTVTLDPAFAVPLPPFTFWQDALAFILMGGFMGALGYSFLKAISECTEGGWMIADGNQAYPEASTLGFGKGKSWWIAIGAGTGLVVGATKALLGVDVVPGILIDLRELLIEPIEGLKIGLVVLLGLLGGVPMGPEMGLGSLAGGLGTWVAYHLRTFQTQGPARQRLYVGSAMVSAFAGLMPSPLTALLLVSEIGKVPYTIDLSYMHITVLLSAGALVAYGVYYAIAGYTYISPQAVYYAANNAMIYNQDDLGIGILFGLMGAGLGTIWAVIGAVIRGFASRLRPALEQRFGKPARQVIMATLGGVLYGLLGWGMPLTLTDGATQLRTIIVAGKQMSSGMLAASCFAKMLSYHICTECGFLGGLFLPMMIEGVMMGQVFINNTSVNPSLAIVCSVIAVPAAVVPAPVFLTLLAVATTQVTIQYVVPVFSTACTAYLFTMGLGHLQHLARRAAQRKAAAKAAQEAAAHAALATTGEGAAAADGVGAASRPSVGALGIEAGAAMATPSGLAV